MAVSDLVYRQGIIDLASQALTWKTTGGTSSLVQLVLDSEVPDKDADTAIADVSVATGSTIETVTPQDTTTGTNLVYFPVSQTSWTFTTPTASQTIGGVVFYHTTSLICLSAITTGTFVTDGSDVTINAASLGVFEIPV